MELLKAIGLVPDEKEEKGENAAESVQETDEGRSGSSGSVPTNQRAATTTPTIMADGGPPLVDLGSDTSAARRRRSTSTAEVLNKLEEVVFFWSASHKTSKPDEAVAADPHANTSADSFESPTHSGWLTKQGAIHKTWRKRYFVLNQHLLYYFDGSSARRPKGVIDLTGCEVMRDMTRGKKHCFQVSHKKNMQQRIFLLHAKGDDDMKHWMRVINAAIDSTRPPGEGTASPSSPSSSPLSAAKASPRQLGSSSSSPTPSDEDEDDNDEEGQEAARDKGWSIDNLRF